VTVGIYGSPNPLQQKAARIAQRNNLEQKAVWMYRGGEKIYDICTKLEIMPGRLYRILHKHDVPLRKA